MTTTTPEGTFLDGNEIAELGAYRERVEACKTRRRMEGVKL